MPEERSEEADVTSDEEYRGSLSESDEPHSEATFNVPIKKAQREAVEDPEGGPQTVQFEISLQQTSSDEVSPPQIQILQPDGWDLEPLTIETPTVPEITELRLPPFRIWEQARLQPVPVDTSDITAVEIGLPPRPLLSVSPDSEEHSSTGSENERTGSDTTDDSDDEQADEKEPSEESIEGQLLDLDEFLFDISGGDFGSYDPLCIVAAKTSEEEYEQTLQTLCREQFRQYRGGKPHAELLVEDEAEELETASVENRIITHDEDSEDEYLDFKSQLGEDEIKKELQEGDLDLSKLHARLDEFFTETLGYLLLFVDEQYSETLYDHLQATDRIRESTQIRHLRPRLLPEDVKRELVRLAWGNVPVESEHTQLDRQFQTAEAEFKESLKPSDPLVEMTSHDVGEESVLHYWVKCLVVEYLMKREGLIPIQEQSRIEVKDEISTETQLKGGQDPIPDVYHEQSREVFEVETLYGTHHKKITRTVDKYEGVNVKRVNVVLPNLTLLRNLSAVIGKTQDQPGEMFRNEVKFWTMDVAGRDLIPLEDILSEMSDLQSRAELLW